MRFMVFLLCFLPSLALAQEDEGGGTFLTRFVENALSGENRNVVITGFSGALSSRATIERMTFADDEGIWMTIDDAVLDWNRTALLRGRIEISELAAEHIAITRTPETAEPAGPAPEARPFALPELPVAVRINRLDVARLDLGAALFGQEATFTAGGSVQLERGEGTAALDIRRIDGPEARFRLEGHYDNATRELDLDLDLSEDQDGIISRLIGVPGTPALSLTIDGSGTLDDFAARISLVTDDVERLAGRVTLITETDAEGRATRRFSTDVAGDIAPLFAPDYQDFFGPEIVLQSEGARLPDGRVVLSQLDLRAQALILRGELEIGADGLPERVDVTGRIGTADGSPILLPIRPRTRITSADLVLALDGLADDNWNLRLQIAGLDRRSLGIEALRLTGAGTIRRDADGRFIGGTLAYAAQGIDPRDAALRRALGDDIGGEMEILWQDDGQVQLPRFTLSGEDYGLAGNAIIAGLEEALTINGTISARGDDIARLSDLAKRDLSGTAAAEVTGSYATLTGAFDAVAAVTGTDLRFDQPEVDRLLAGESRIELSARRNTDGLTLRSLRATATTLSALAHGQLATAGSDITAELDFSDLSVLGGPFRGALVGTARFTETEGGPQRLRLEATAQGLAIGQDQADRLLAGESTISLDATRADEVITVEALQVNAATLAARVTGTLAEGASALAASLGFSDLSVLGPGFAGALEAEAQLNENGALRRLQLEAQGTNLAIGQTQADALLRGPTQLALDATEENGRLRVQAFTLSNPQLTASATGAAEGDSRLVNLTARLANLAVIQPEFPGPLTIAGTITENGSYGVDVTAQGPGGIDARITGSAASDLSAVDLAVVGSAQAALANLFIQPRSVTGPLNFNLRLNGPPALASVSGNLTGQGLRIVDPELGLTLEQGNVRADLAGGQATIAASAGFPQGGQLSLSGPISLTAPFNADLRLALQDARLVDPELYETSVSGTVAITGPLAGGGRITGELRLGETNLRIPSTGFGPAGYIPEPMTHVNEPAAVRETRSRAGLLGDGRGNGATGGGAAPFSLDVTISAPNQVFIRGRGLDAELGGAIQLTGTTANIIPIGEFSLIRGRLDLLGQRFVLDEGLARLQGRFVPYIRLAASTESEGVSVTILVEGEANEPEIRFLSSPDLPEEEVLARLLFGRGLTNLSPLQAAQLAGAVATLAGRGGEGIVGRLRQNFGLDDLDITTDEDGGTGVRLGRYLSENIYTDVTVGSDGTTEINLNLDVSRSVTVRGRLDNSGETGLGVYYERDY
ncbi:translocation/assembly module TamB domain-containing protein [Plastorhodobacter daqingensis]|uniref:Translocation/assembly module TamB domain-containing protein n=1 Tax=Plastorhodobacter daqingensis TaxID=1387281 RepID=A0ABW2UMB9_9RHOB